MAPLKPIDDLVIQVRRLVGTVNSVLERYSRAAEELDGIQLSLEELRAVMAEHFAENSRWADKLEKRMDRVEQYIILSKFGNVQATLQLEGAVTKEHIERALGEELVSQRELWLQYQRNLDRVNIRIAKFGETTQLINEVDEYEKKMIKIEEATKRIGEALTELEKKRAA